MYKEKVPLKGKADTRPLKILPRSSPLMKQKKKKALGNQAAASKALLTSAEKIINSAIKQKDMNKVTSGHVLLTEGNANLEQAPKENLANSKGVLRRKKQH